MTALQTVVELDTFLRRAKAIMSDEERMEIVVTLATNPEAGVALGGGLRKVRISRPDGGKSGAQSREVRRVDEVARRRYPSGRRRRFGRVGSDHEFVRLVPEDQDRDPDRGPAHVFVARDL